MTSDRHDAATEQRHGCGVFDCPLNNCDDIILGSYSDLIRHVDGHPLARLVVNEDGTHLVDEIKKARSEALSKDIRQVFKVTEDEQEETQ